MFAGPEKMPPKRYAKESSGTCRAWNRLRSRGVAPAGAPRFRRSECDSLAGWLEAYFTVEVTTAASSRAVQRRDLTRFVRFMLAEEGSDERPLWTSRLSRAFLDALRSEVDEQESGAFPTARSPASPRI
jgi:hypothetical protein